MKILYLLPLLVLTGCNSFQSGVATTWAEIANIVGNSQRACADIAALGLDTNAVAQQVAAANPNNARIQSIAQKIANGVAVTNADCQLLASTVSAEAPRSLLHKKVLIDPKVFHNL